MYECVCPTKLFPRDTSAVRNPERVLEPRQEQNVGGVFLATATQTYANWNDLLQHHRHHQSTLSCSLQLFSNGKLPSVISSPRSCRATRISLIGHRASSTRVFPLVAFLSPTGPGVEEGSLIQLNAAVYGLVNAPSAWRTTIVRGNENLGYRKYCYDPSLRILLDGWVWTARTCPHRGGRPRHSWECGPRRKHGETPEDLQIRQVEEHLQ